jgi:hypothetical protein
MTAVLAPAHGFAWLPLAKEQYPIAHRLYDRYCERFSLPRGGNPGGGLWFGIVELDEEGKPGKLGGVLGVAFDQTTAALEIAGLYVYPTRRGVRAMEATVRRVAELYDQGHLRFVCCHVLVENTKMERRLAPAFESRNGRIRAHLWGAGTVVHPGAA